MSTIRIDRGFTQKIQQKGLVHSAAAELPPPKRKGQSGRKKGFPVALVAIGGVCVLGGLVGAAVFLGGDKGKAKPAKAAAQPVTPAAPTAPAQPKPSEPETVADPDEELYAKHSGQPAPQTAQQQQYKPSQAPIRAVWREMPVGGSQGLRCDYYENIPGKAISLIRASAAFPDRPSRTVQVGNFALSEDIAENYGVCVRGYLAPSASGKYTFSACGDDGVEFWLSSDDSPSNKRRLIGYESCVPKDQWTHRSDQQSPECELKAGQRYYLEALLKENTGHDYLFVAWKGPVSERYVVIDRRFLQPWTESSAGVTAQSDAPPDRRKAREALEAALAPARAAVEEQQRKHASAYRFAEAAEALKNSRSAWKEAEALALVETAILRLELLGRLRACVQGELAKAPVRGLWTAFGGQADVTTATDEGVTVAPGRIVAWAKIPPDHMLKLINATVPKAVCDTQTKGVLFLAAGVFCKDVTGGVDLALKYRERAVANSANLVALADRVLGGSPESIQAEVRMKASRAELDRLTATAATLAEKVTKQQAELAAVTGLVPGLLAEYWEKNPYGSLWEARSKGLLTKPPDSTQCLNQFETPRDRAEKFVARVCGYLKPAETGEYFFYLAADDQGELKLSTDETPEKLALLVKTDSYCNYRAWDKEKRRSKPVRLEKDKHYFVEALLREGEKNDHLCVAWSSVADDDPQLVSSANLLYAATAGFTPRAQEIRQQIDADLAKAVMLLAQVSKVRQADQERLDEGAAATAAAAEELQRQVSEAKEALRQAEAQLKQLETAFSQLKAAQP